MKEKIRLIVNKHFAYSGSVDDIKKWLSEQGYSIEDVGNYGRLPVKFVIIGTGIRIGYPIVPINQHDNGMAKVHLLNGINYVAEKPREALHGINLYKKLYNKFRQRNK